MIHLSQTYPDEQSVIITVEGDLDSESLPVLKAVCRKHTESGKRITINLEKVAAVDRNGKEMLGEMDSRVQLTGMPAYLEMQIKKR